MIYIIIIDINNKLGENLSNLVYFLMLLNKDYYNCFSIYKLV